MIGRRKFSGPTRTPTTQKIASYCADVLKSLRAAAAGVQLDRLAALIEEAAAEADRAAKGGN